MNSRFIRIALVAPFAAMLLHAGAVRGQDSPATTATTARITFLSLSKGKSVIYLDRAAVAILPGHRTFARVQVEAGPHLLWGSGDGDPEWLNFEAGQQYALVLAQSTTSISTWCLDNSNHCEVALTTEKASETVANASALAELTAKIKPEKYDKARARAGSPGSPGLPADFEVYFRKKGGTMSALFKLDVAKKVHVDASGISVKGGVTIPAAEINMLQLYGADGGMPWMAVGYHDIHDMDLGFFGTREHYNALYSAIALAKAGAKASPDSAGAAH